MEQNLPLYHIFNAVAEEGNISKAAKRLYISQPAVSKAVNRLEESLDTQLFIRNSRGVSLTDAGTMLYDHTSVAFHHLMKAEEGLTRNKALGVGHIKIGASSTLCKYVLLPYLKAFTEENPHIRISIQCQSTFQTLSLLQSHKIDIGLVGKPSHLETIEFDGSREIGDVFVCTPAYLENLLTREELMIDSKKPGFEEILPFCNLMLLDSENISRRYIDSYFRDNDIEPNQILEVSSMDLLIEFAKTGLGVACVIDDFVKDELAAGTLIRLPLATPINKREIGFACIKDYPLSDAAVKFLNFVK